MNNFERFYSTYLITLKRIKLQNISHYMINVSWEGKITCNNKRGKEFWSTSLLSESSNGSDLRFYLQKQSFQPSVKFINLFNFTLNFAYFSTPYLTLNQHTICLTQNLIQSINFSTNLEFIGLPILLLSARRYVYWEDEITVRNRNDTRSKSYFCLSLKVKQVENN